MKPQTRVAAPSRTPNTIAQVNSIGLIYGAFGSGKTYLTSTVHDVVENMDKSTMDIPEGYEVINASLFINAEKGDLTIPKKYKNVIVKNVSSWSDICSVYDFIKLHVELSNKNNFSKLYDLQTKFLGAKAKDLKILFVFKAIIYDSLTEIQTFCVNKLKGITSQTRLDDSLGKLSFNDWSEVLDKMSMLLRYHRDHVPIIKVFVAQCKTDVATKTVGGVERNEYSYSIQLQGQSKDLVAGIFDYVGYYTLKATEKGNERRLWLSPVGPFVAKNRFEGFDAAYISNPCMKDLLKYSLEDDKPKVSARFVF
ncbi:MAG: AAA family ATPase [Paraclostridium sp.]